VQFDQNNAYINLKLLCVFKHIFLNKSHLLLFPYLRG